MPKATDGASKLDQAKEAVQAATETVRETTQSVANAIDAGRKPGAPLDRLARWAQDAPSRNHRGVPGRRAGRQAPQLTPLLELNQVSRAQLL